MTQANGHSSSLAGVNMNDSQSPLAGPAPKGSRGISLPSRVEILAQLKLELVLLAVCVGQISHCVLVYPLRAQRFKEIFMGMKVEMPAFTILVLGYSDLLTNYPLLDIAIAGALLGLLVYGGKVMTDVAVTRHREGPSSFAWYQLLTTGVLVAVLLTALLVGSVIESAYMGPMLHLVNAIE